MGTTWKPSSGDGRSVCIGPFVVELAEKTARRRFSVLVAELVEQVYLSAVN